MQLTGGFNTTEPTCDAHNTGWLRRESHRNGRETLAKICDEFASYGWIDRGNTVRRRTINEQIDLCRQANRLHLMTHLPATNDRGSMLVPYIAQAESIDCYLARASAPDARRVVRTLYVDAKHAHQNGIVYGDRWSENILVSGAQYPTATHIDFDLQYEGPEAKEMEMARLSFYLLHSGREKVRSIIAGCLRDRCDLNLSTLETIVRGHVRYFECGRFGGADQLVDDLFQEVHSLSFSTYAS